MVVLVLWTSVVVDTVVLAVNYYSCGCGLSNECLLWGLEAVCRKWEFVLKGGEKLLGEGENSVKLLVCVRSARASVAMAIRSSVQIGRAHV